MRATNGGGGEDPQSPPLDVADQLHTVRQVLVTLLVALVLYTFYLASGLILPILLAGFFAILFNPFVAFFSRRGVARWLAALAVVLAGLALVSGILAVSYEPAAQWVKEAPRALRNFAPELRNLMRPLEEVSRATESLPGMSDDERSVEVVESSPVSIRFLLRSMPQVAVTVFAMVMLVYFFLVYGELLLRRSVTLFPTLSEKKRSVDIVRSIQSDMSRYVLTITLINSGLALATALALWMLGVDVADALFWGFVAGALNYAPYVGPLFAALLLTLFGLVEFDTLGTALLPAAMFMALNIIEGQIVTPLMLGRSLELNPLVILLWLLFWGWIWGIAGLLLGVPMLVCFKIVCSRVESLNGWSVMLGK